MAHTEEHRKHPLERFLELVHLEVRETIAIILYGALIGFFNLVVPIAASALINTIAFGTLLQPLVVLTLLVLFFLLVSGALSAIQIYLMEMMQRRIFLRLFLRLAAKYTRLPAATFDVYYMPEYTNRFFDVVKLQKSFTFLVMDGTALLLTTVIGLVIISIYHPLFIMFNFFFLFTAIFVLIYWMGQGGIRSAINVSHVKYDSAAWLQEITRNPRVFRTGWGSDYALERARELGDRYLNSEQRHFRIVLRQSIGFLILRAISHSTILGIGGYLVMNEKLTLGQLVAAELIISGVLSSLGKFSKFLSNFYDTMVALDKTGHLTDLHDEDETGLAVHFASKPVKVEIKKLRLQSHESDRYIDLEMSVKPGETVAITDYDGDAKNLLFDILGGEIEPPLGKVFYNHEDIKELNKRDLRSEVMLIRDTETFAGSIFENITLGRSEIKLSEVSMAIDLVNLTKAFSRFPSGLDTMLLPSGAPLSSDEKRRLLIARALVMRPGILLIDEALDTIDDEVILALKTRWFDTQKTPTMIIASQNPNVLSMCSRCYNFSGKASFIGKSVRKRRST